MTTATNASAAELLEEWITGERLTSYYDVYVNAKIRFGNSFYTQLLAEKGETAAEEALRKWEAKKRMRAFAAGIEPVAKGMLALARTDIKGERAKVVDVVDKNGPFPYCYDISGPSKMIVMFNQRASGYVRNEPIGSEIFATYGQLGLKAVTLQVGWSHQHSSTAAQLGLVLPQRVLDAKDVNRDSYTVVAVELNGYTNCYTYSPGLYRDGYLQYALGLIKKEQAVGCISSSGGSFDSAVGFPGATNYLADALPKLGEYFTAMAEKLSSDHKQ
jgi:hypothetical protein